MVEQKQIIINGNSIPYSKTPLIQYQSKPSSHSKQKFNQKNPIVYKVISITFNAMGGANSPKCPSPEAWPVVAWRVQPRGRFGNVPHRPSPQQRLLRSPINGNPNSQTRRNTVYCVFCMYCVCICEMGVCHLWLCYIGCWIERAEAWAQTSWYCSKSGLREKKEKKNTHLNMTLFFLILFSIWIEFCAQWWICDHCIRKLMNL